MLPTKPRTCKQCRKSKPRNAYRCADTTYRSSANHTVVCAACNALKRTRLQAQTAERGVIFAIDYNLQSCHRSSNGYAYTLTFTELGIAPISGWRKGTKPDLLAHLALLFSEESRRTFNPVGGRAGASPPWHEFMLYKESMSSVSRLSGGALE